MIGSPPSAAKYRPLDLTMKPLTAPSASIPCPPPPPAPLGLGISAFGFRTSFGLRPLASALLLPFVLQSLAAGPQVLPGHVPAVVARLQPLNRLPASQRLNLDIGLPLRNQAELATFLRDLYDPASPVYRSYLTPGQFTDRFGPSRQDYQAVIDFANASNLRVTATSPNRLILNVEGAAADIEKAFHVRLYLYQHPAEPRTFYAPDTEPSLDITTSILHIAGLNNYFRPKPMLVREPANVPRVWTPDLGSGPNGTYLGNDFRAAYIPGTSLTGAFETVGLVQFDGYFPSDIASYEAIAGLPNVPLQNVLIDGFNGVPGQGNGEVCLDIEMCVSMAPGLSQVLVYEAPNGFPTGQTDLLNQMANDNLASQLSSSWSLDDDPITFQIDRQFQAQGQSFFQSAGDTCSYYIGNPDYEDNPYVTIVGGTTLSTAGPGGGYVSETVWNRGGGMGTGGGISTNYAIPPWQQNVNMSTNGGSAKMRNVPDVAFTAENIFTIADNGQGEPVGGTSAAAPLWAAFTSLINQQAFENGEAPVGFLNPAIYAIAQSQYYPTTFHDITTGNNTNAVNTNLFYAFPGYDLCTGWGTPNGTNIVNLLAPPIGEVPLLGYVTNYIYGGNGSGSIDPDACNNLNVVLTNFGGVTATGVRVTLSSPTPGILIVQPTSLYGTILTNSAATNLVPFEISTAPTFPCGTPVQFMITVSSAQSVRQISPRFRLSTGIPAAPLRYDNSSDFPIPDLGQADSPIVVSGFPSAVVKATVSLFVTDNYDSDLVLQLIAPDGAKTTLSANNGGSGQNYGLACSPDDARTTFDDDASLPIAAAVAPFVGAFSPDKPLSVFIGKSGTNVNGAWKLRAIDQYPENIGAINCWSLFLTPAVCLPGGGECQGADVAVSLSAVPNPVIIGDILTYSISVTNGGPSSTDSTVVTQLIPFNLLQFVTASPSQGSWSFSSGIVTFDLGPMPALSAATATVTCLAINSGQSNSTATVTSDQPNFNPVNSTATVLTQVLPPTADLAVSISAVPSAPLVGGTLTYTVTTVNNGPSPASGVILTDVLPDNTALLSATVSQGSAAISGNTVVCGFGSLVSSASATATFNVTTLASGSVTDSASVFGDQFDPNPANNTNVLVTPVGAAAALSVSVSPSQNPVVLFSNLTYFITVSNAGPSTATSVVLTHALDRSLSFVSMKTSQGSISQSGNMVTASLGTIAANASALVTVQVVPTIQGPVQTSSSVIGAQPNPFPSNSSVTTLVQVSPPFISIVSAGATLVSQTPDGAIDNGETVTVSLRLRNAGNVSNTNLVATLLATNGVTPLPPNIPQDYGILPPGSSFAAQQFSFTAGGTPGSTISAVLQLQDGSNLLTNTVSYNFTLPSLLTFSSTNPIVILSDTAAAPYAPYPSTIHVSGLTGILSRVTATLSGFTHNYPRDVDVLLVAPTGANTLLMSHAANQPADNLDLTFEDDDSLPTMPRFGSLSSTAYRPTAYAPAPIFSNPAPAGPYTAVLSALNGINPNGLWSLFVQDDYAGDSGAISNGWSLTLTAVTPVNPVADLALLAVSPPSPALVSDNLSFSFIVTNGGPSSASNLTFSNPLPANVLFVSAYSSQGTIGLSGNAVIGNLGSINAGSTAAVAVVFAPTPAAKGVLTNTATVSATEIDLNPANNTASSSILLTLPFAELAVSQTFTPNPVVVGYPLTNTIAVTNLGPGVAIDVLVTDLLPTNTTFVSATATAGSCTNNGGLLTCALGSLGPDAGASIALVLIPRVASPVTFVPVAYTASAQTNLSSDSATNSVTVNGPAPALLPAGAVLLSGNGPANGGVNPGETVTVSLYVTNAGTADTSTNLTATLLDSGGVTPAANPQAVYGVVRHGGPAVAQPFTFTASNIELPPSSQQGPSITATLLLQDVQTLGNNLQATNLYTNSFLFVLPVRETFASQQSVRIPGYGQGAPYPSTLVISGVTGLVSEATVNFVGLSHNFPSDMDALLVSPAGTPVLLMAHAGTNYSISDVTLFFDDTGAPLPASAQIYSGTYRPTAYSPRTLPSPAPQGPYPTILANLDGWNPNGTWSLYMVDDEPGDSGTLDGWGLTLTIVNPLNALSADVGVSASAPSVVLSGSNVTYSISISNSGPSTAAGVTVTDPLPDGVHFQSAVSSQGSYSLGDGVVTFNLGALSAGASASASLSLLPSQYGFLTNTMTVASQETDLNPANNSAQSVTDVLGLSIRQAANGQYQLTVAGAPGQTYVIQSSPDLSSWTPVSTNTAQAGGPIVFPITPQSASRAFYRVLQPAP